MPVLCRDPYRGLRTHPALVGLLWIPIWLAILLIPLRALFQPMILRFGHADQADTHGSARFATNAEARDLMGDAGLLIDRDRKSGKLLRYPGPAHPGTPNNPGVICPKVIHCV